MKFIIVQASLLATGLAIALAAPAQTTAAGPYYATPSWDQQIPAATRFIVLSNWDSKAVLDRETGLVWERDPLNERSPTFAQEVFGNAVSLCIQSHTGGRKGWRLPSISELQSLYDASGASSGLMLPIGHPFKNIQTLVNYWSSTTDAIYVQTAYAQGFSPRGSVITDFKSQRLGIWCVRGPGGNNNSN